MTTTTTTHRGAPIGVYTILYYHVEADGSRRQMVQCDRDLSADGAHRACDRLGPDEQAVVSCVSAPGGWTTYGSADAADRHRQHRAVLGCRAVALRANRPEPLTVDGVTLAIDDCGYLASSADADTSVRLVERLAASSPTWPGLAHARRLRRAVLALEAA